MARKKRPRIIEKGMLRMVEWATKVDSRTVTKKVQALRALHPDWGPEELAEYSIKEKCKYTARVGAATSATGMVPVFGTAVSLTVGMLVDLGSSLTAQAELVLELAEIYDYPLTEANKRETILVVLGLGTGTEFLAKRAGREATERLAKHYAKRWAARVIPVLGIATSASSAALSTYLIGRRAERFFTQGEAAMGDWKDSLRAFSGMDERKLLSWLQETRQRMGDSLKQLPGKSLLKRPEKKTKKTAKKRVED